MARSVSLAAYLAYARRSVQAWQSPDIERPEGELVWGHAVDAGRADALIQLANRLVLQRPGVKMLLTTTGDKPIHVKPGSPVIWQRLPDDTIATAEAFLDHWTPDICLWTGGDLQPAILTCADKTGIPLFLVDADQNLLTRPVWRWFPDLPRAILRRFSVIMARSAKAGRELRRIGTGDTEIIVTGPLQEGAMALPYNQSDHDELSALLRGRPVWLAAMLQPDELPTVLDAHRAVSKLAHRALLVVVPDDLEKGSLFCDQLANGGWRHVVWSDGALPEETTQVLLADTRGELGLWYLLASTTFMGSSLHSGQTGRDPNEPAAHGSAILYGPNVGRYLAGYSRYAEAGAARIVRDTSTLAAAVRRLIAPDHSATMAHAAWDVASQGAEVTDQVLDLVQDTLDVMEPQR